jgi:hypothetical protein
VNAHDLIDRFFDWPEEIDEESSLAEQLPSSDLVEATRMWWRQVMKVAAAAGTGEALVIEESDGVVHCGVFASEVAAHALPTPAMMIDIDWWQLHGRAQAHDLYAQCLNCLQRLGRA